MEKSDFTIGSLWVRKIQEYDPFYFLVIKTRSLDVQFAGFRFEDTTRGVGTYFFNFVVVNIPQTTIKKMIDSHTYNPFCFPYFGQQCGRKSHRLLHLLTTY